MVQTITVQCIADTYMASGQPTWNNGSNLGLAMGYSGPTTVKCRSLLRFKIPKFKGTIISQKLRVYVRSVGSASRVGVYLVKSPKDDAWVEGTSNSTPDVIGASWNDYAVGYTWTTPGGDFEDNPVGVYYVNSTGSKDFTINIDNDIFKSGSTVSLLLKVGGTEMVESCYIDSREATFPPVLILEVEIDDFVPPEDFVAAPVSSTAIKLTWKKSEVDLNNFTSYLIEQSATGTGSWTTVATISNIDTTEYTHSALVTQAQINFYDNLLDTYPNGRKIYYRVSVVTEYGATGYSTTNATTIPAMRPMMMTSLTPRSKYFDTPIAENNKSLNPYGVYIEFDWFDSNYITEIEYFNRVVFYVSEWFTIFYQPTANQETMSYNELLENGFAFNIAGESGIGYNRLQIYARVYDSGGLYRVMTLDKIAQQLEICFPAPCPVAIPNGPFASAPPNMGGPFVSGENMVIDFSTVGQQRGGMIFVEDFLTTPTNSGKWVKQPIGTSNLIYNGNVLEAHLDTGTKAIYFWKELYDEYPTQNFYNRWISKYTGGYRTVNVFRFPTPWVQSDWNMVLSVCAWTHNGYTSSGGYVIEFNGLSDSVSIYRRNNFTGGSVVNLGTWNLGSSHPRNVANIGKYWRIEFITSPCFGTIESDAIFICYKIANTLAEVLTEDYATMTSKMYAIFDVSRPAGEQKHSTGRECISVTSTGGQTVPLEIHHSIIEGRVGAVDSNYGQGYGFKNMTTGEVQDPLPYTMPQINVFCRPDQVSETVMIEGRVKNEYGAQSRTGGIDAYQGDIFYNSKPFASIIGPSYSFKNTIVSFNGSLSSDPEGGSLIYTWDFGDGSLPETYTSPIATHKYTATGTYEVKLKVTDEAGLVSDEEIHSIIVYEEGDLFIPLTFICPEPFTDINLVREPGDSESGIPGQASTYYQNNMTGGRQFEISGHTVECKNLSDAELIENARKEIEMLDGYNASGQLLTLTLPIFGVVKGFISGFKPVIEEQNPRFWTWSFVFKEVDPMQFGGAI